jgi:phosphoribosyl-ATP pyrophosphohydrolase
MGTASAQSMTASTAEPRSDIGSIRQLQDDLKRALEDPERFPRTIKLLAAGTAQQSKKVIEEAAELAIEALRRDRDAAIREAADLIYNMVVLLDGMDIPFEDICRELERRRTLYGIAAKQQKNGTSELLTG